MDSILIHSNMFTDGQYYSHLLVKLLATLRRRYRLSVLGFDYSRLLALNLDASVVLSFL